MAACWGSQELELGAAIVFEAPGTLGSGTAGRGVEGAELATALSGRPGKSLQAIVQQG